MGKYGDEVVQNLLTRATVVCHISAMRTVCSSLGFLNGVAPETFRRQKIAGFPASLGNDKLAKQETVNPPSPEDFTFCGRRWIGVGLFSVDEFGWLKELGFWSAWTEPWRKGRWKSARARRKNEGRSEKRIRDE